MAEETALPQPGEVFAGRYLIEQIIGSAKLSVVFGARHGVTGRRFAIRWSLPGEDVSAPEVVSAVEPSMSASGEHQVVGHFRHPNVLEVYDVGEVAGSLYTVMDWVEGESLAARLKRLGPLPVSEARRLLVPAMRGMHEAHGAGILHRDLTPANIFICHATDSSPELVKVLDFQIVPFSGAESEAAILSALSQPSAGIPYYRAPELLGELPSDHRADVYAFGAILYEVLSGRPPYAPTRYNSPDAAHGHALAIQHRTDNLPFGALQIIARAMLRDVDERFQSLSELADALEACATNIASSVVTRHTQFLSESARRTGGMSTPLFTESVRNSGASPDSQVASLSNKQWQIVGGLVALTLGIVLYLSMRDPRVVASFEAGGDGDGAAVELDVKAPAFAPAAPTPRPDHESSRSAATDSARPSPQSKQVTPEAPSEGEVELGSGADSPRVAHSGANTARPSPVGAAADSGAALPRGADPNLPTWRFPSRGPIPNAPAPRGRRVDSGARPSKSVPAQTGAARGRAAGNAPPTAAGERDPLDMNLM